jgi:hypothetical protein
MKSPFIHFGSGGRMAQPASRLSWSRRLGLNLPFSRLEAAPTTRKMKKPIPWDRLFSFGSAAVLCTVPTAKIRIQLR